MYILIDIVATYDYWEVEERKKYIARLRVTKSVVNIRNTMLRQGLTPTLWQLKL